MNLLSLFSGAGLGDLGWLMAGFNIVGQCEIDEYCQKVLALRFPESVKYTDIRKLNGEQIKKDCGAVDIVAGGFPCQPFSSSGTHKGHEDQRWLWPTYASIIREIKPKWVVGENVRGLLSNNDGWAFGEILSDLARFGYDASWFCFPASIFGAPHPRDRVWVVANSNGDGQSKCEDLFKVFGNLGNNFKPHSKSNWAGIEVDRENEETIFKSMPKPLLLRMDDVTPEALDRLKALGNGQVVACTAFIGRQIMEFERLT